MDQKPRLHGEQGSSLPVLPIQRHPRASDDRNPARRDASRREDYTIAWICALTKELKVSRRMLDDDHVSPPIAGDDNMYVLGHVSKHKVVMTSLGDEPGTTRAAIVATNLKRSFRGICATFMVGIGGGAPSMGDIRLGVVVVGTRV